MVSSGGLMVCAKTHPRAAQQLRAALRGIAATRRDQLVDAMVVVNVSLSVLSLLCIGILTQCVYKHAFVVVWAVLC